MDKSFEDYTSLESVYSRVQYSIDSIPSGCDELIEALREGLNVYGVIGIIRENLSSIHGGEPLECDGTFPASTRITVHQ